MKILVTGSHGQVGREVVSLGRDAGHVMIGRPRASLDITNAYQVQRVVDETACNVVVNAAAWTDVERAETNLDLAMAVNRDGVVNLADACRSAAIPLIHISTDYVFDGRKSEPYMEDDLPAPLNVYGRSKLEGEEQLRNRLAHHIILRTGWLYGDHGRNFVRTIQSLASSQSELRVVADQRGTPTPTSALARAILQIAVSTSGDGRWGTYHYAARGCTTWFGFAEAICALAGQTPKLVAIDSDEYEGAAVRPAYSVLDCSRSESVFGVARPYWRTALAQALRAARPRSPSRHPSAGSGDA